MNCLKCCEPVDILGQYCCSDAVEHGEAAMCPPGMGCSASAEHGWHSTAWREQIAFGEVEPAAPAAKQQWHVAGIIGRSAQATRWWRQWGSR